MVIVDTQAAATAVQVKPNTITTWQRRGHLEPIGKDQRGRTTYNLDQVRRVAQGQRPGVSK